MDATATPNQLVAYNLRRARDRRGWTQEETAERLEPFLGERLSKASYSALERAVTGERARRFDADFLYALARVFDLPIAFFLAPPSQDVSIAPRGATETTSREQGFELCFGLPEKAQEVLVGDVLELSANTTQALNRWRDDWTDAAAKRETFIDQFLGSREAETKEEAE